MAHIDNTYHKILSEILERGYDYDDPNRQGIKRKEISSATLRHEFKNGFPVVTTRKIYTKGAIGELLFFLSGSTDIRGLWRRGVDFWTPDWARYKNLSKQDVDTCIKEWVWDRETNDEVYKMGSIYPKQYRNFGGVDQIKNLIETMKSNPMSTSLIVNSWNVGELKEMCLPPCHYSFQVVCRPLSAMERKVIAGDVLLEYEAGLENLEDNLNSYNIPKYGFELHWSQRSTDFYLGTCTNVVFYSDLCKLLEVITGYKALAVQGDLKNVHLYDNQIAAAKEQVTRDTERNNNCELRLSEKAIKDIYHYNKGNISLDTLINNLTTEDFILEGYESYPAIKVPMLTYDTNK